MGYLLPIQQHAYQNYQYRMYKTDKSPHEIGNIKMVKFIPIQEDVDFLKKREVAMRQKKKYFNKRDQRGITGNKNAYKITLREERELIGKGYYVNLLI